MTPANKTIAYLFLTLSIISIYGKPIMGLFGFGLLNFLDEGILILSILLLATVIPLTQRATWLQLLVLAFFLYSVGISLLFGYNKNFIDVFLQSLINLKFFLIFMPFLILFRQDQSMVEGYFKTILIISMVGFVFHLILGTTFTQIFGLEPSFRFGRGMRYGGFLSPNQMAFMMVMLIGITLARVKRKKQAITLKDWSIIAASLAIVVLTGSRTTLAAIAIFFIWFYWEEIKKNANSFISFSYAFAFVITVILVSSDVLETVWSNLQGSLSLDSYYIRGIIIYIALQITVDYFPIGTGAATFGSLLSDNSPVYENFGVADRYFFIEKVGIYDSSVASILGEYGLLGILFYASIVLMLRKHLFILYGISDIRMLNAMFLVFAFYSITNPIFTNNIYILMSIPAFMIIAHCGKPLAGTLQHSE